MILTTEQAMEKLNQDLKRWTSAEKSEVAEQLRAAFGVSKSQLRAMPCSRWIN